MYWPIILLVVAALVLMPRAWRLAGLNTADWVYKIELPAAVGLGLALGWPPGGVAALLSLAWLLVTGRVAWLGTQRLWALWQHRTFDPWAVAANLGLVYLVVGGGWASLHCFGLRPLGFNPIIVLMTALHFHYAGCILPILASAAGRALERTYPSPLTRWAALGTCASVPLVALGITLTQLGFSPLPETLAALCMAGSGLGVALAYLRLARQPGPPPPARLCWGLAALALTFGMTLASLYALRPFFPELPLLSALSWPVMWSLHGTANALGMGGLGLLGWWAAGAKLEP